VSNSQFEASGPDSARDSGCKGMATGAWVQWRSARSHPSDWTSARLRSFLAHPTVVGKSRRATSAGSRGGSPIVPGDP
jgi:hypothetical protein